MLSTTAHDGKESPRINNEQRFMSAQYTDGLVHIIQSPTPPAQGSYISLSSGNSLPIEQEESFYLVHNLLYNITNWTDKAEEQAALLTYILGLEGVEVAPSSIEQYSKKWGTDTALINILNKRREKYVHAGEQYEALRKLSPLIKEKLGLDKVSLGAEGQYTTLAFKNYRGYDVSYRFGQQGRDKLEISSSDGATPLSFHIHEGVASVNFQEAGGIEEFQANLDSFIDAMDSYRQSFPNITSSESLPVHQDWVQGRWQYTVRGKGMHSIRIGNN